MVQLVGGYILDVACARAFLTSIWGEPDPDELIDAHGTFMRLSSWFAKHRKDDGLPYLNWFCTTDGAMFLYMPAFVCEAPTLQVRAPESDTARRLRARFIAATRGAYPEDKLRYKCVPRGVLGAALLVGTRPKEEGPAQAA